MKQLDEDIMRAYFRLEEAQRQRLWLQRLWHPELFDWAKQGAPPPITRTKEIRQEELAKLGFDELKFQEMEAMEKAAYITIRELTGYHPLAPHFERIRGLSLYTGGAFIAASGDIEHAPTVSAFWKRMGLDVLNEDLTTESGTVILKAGQVPRRIRGSVKVDRRIPALPHVTRVGEQIRSQIMRSGGKLKDWYDHFKAREPADKQPIFRHKSAQRLTQKLLYSALWREWRIAYDLPAPEPYAFAILRHDSGSLVTISDFYETGD